MNDSKVATNYVRTVRELPGILLRWHELDEDTRDVYLDGLETVLLRRQVHLAGTSDESVLEADKWMAVLAPSLATKAYFDTTGLLAPTSAIGERTAGILNIAAELVPQAPQMSGPLALAA